MPRRAAHERRRAAPGGSWQPRSTCTPATLGLRGILTGEARRTSLVLGGSHILNWFPVQVFSVLGTTVLVNVHGVSFSNSLVDPAAVQPDRLRSAT